MTDANMLTTLWCLIGALTICIVFVPTICESVGRMLIAHAAAFRAARAEYGRIYTTCQQGFRTQE